MQYWPQAAIAQGLAIPGFCKNNAYDYHLLTFWLSKWPSDTALIFENAIGFFSTENPWNAQTNVQL